MIKNCSVHTQTAWKLDQKAPDYLSFSLRQTSASIENVKAEIQDK